MCRSLEQSGGWLPLSEDVLSQQFPAMSLTLLTQDGRKPVLHKKKIIQTLSFISSFNSNKVITRDRLFLLMKITKCHAFVSNFSIVYMFINFNFKTNLNILHV